MGESGCYKFCDLGSRVEVRLQIASDLASSDIDVQATADSLRITEHKNSAVLLNVTQLYSTVAAAATEHTAANGKLTVTLQKLDQKLSWPAFEVESMSHANGTEDADSGNQTSRAMQEREKVKALLTAAQSGSVADVQQAAEQFGQDSLAEVKDGTGKNCLHFAAQTGQTDVCNYLLTELHFDPAEQEDAGMYISLQDAQPVLHYATNASSEHQTANLLGINRCSSSNRFLPSVHCASIASAPVCICSVPHPELPLSLRLAWHAKVSLVSPVRRSML